MKSNDNLGSLVKIKRKQNNLSARKLAELCGVSHTEINNIEKGGRVKPALLTLKGFEKYLGIPFREIAESCGYSPETIEFGDTEIIVSYEIYDKLIKEYKEEMNNLFFTIEQKKRVGTNIIECVDKLQELVDDNDEDIQKNLNLINSYAKYIEQKYIPTNPKFVNKYNMDNDDMTS